MTEQEKAVQRVLDRLTREWRMAHTAGENANRELPADFADECKEDAEVLYELIDFLHHKLKGDDAE